MTTENGEPKDEVELEFNCNCPHCKGGIKIKFKGKIPTVDEEMEDVTDESMVKVEKA